MAKALANTENRSSQHTAAARMLVSEESRRSFALTTAGFGVGLDRRAARGRRARHFGSPQIASERSENPERHPSRYRPCRRLLRPSRPPYSDFASSHGGRLPALALGGRRQRGRAWRVRRAADAAGCNRRLGRRIPRRQQRSVPDELWIPDPPPTRDPAHEARLRGFLAGWGRRCRPRPATPRRPTSRRSARRCWRRRRRSCPPSWASIPPASSGG